MKYGHLNSLFSSQMELSDARHPIFLSLTCAFGAPPSGMEEAQSMPKWQLCYLTVSKA